MTLKQLKLLSDEQVCEWTVDKLNKLRNVDNPHLSIGQAPASPSSIMWIRQKLCTNGKFMRLDYSIYTRFILPRNRPNHGLVIKIHRWNPVFGIPATYRSAFRRLATLFECRLSRTVSKCEKDVIMLHALTNDRPVVYVGLAMLTLAAGNEFDMIKNCELAEIEWRKDIQTE